MWSSLRSDLKEFASSIATDATDIRENIESKLVITENDPGDDGSTNSSPSEEAGGILMGENGEVTYMGDSNGYAATGIISDAEDEALRRAGKEETYTAPLLANEVNGQKHDSPRKSKSNEASDTATADETGDDTPAASEEQQDSAPEEEDGWGDDEDPLDPSLKEETEQKPEPAENDEFEGEGENSADNTDVPPVVEAGEAASDDPAAVAFLDSFDIHSKTEEIAEILAEHPDTVKLHFESLVPLTVTYEQFWQRYYFRCDPDRIQQEWDEENERVRKERKELIDKGKQTVQNLFGGALKAIKNAGNGENVIGKESSIYEKYQAELEEKRRALAGSGADAEPKENKAGGLSGLFRGRPPFVLNTAVDDDDDEEEDISAGGEEQESDEDFDEDEEDDDEFGWGSDDEDDYLSEEDGEEEERSEASEEVVFGSPIPSNTPEMNKLREELAKALELKDELQETVNVQSEQLKKNQRETSDGAENNDEVEELKLSLFKKESEVAALKVSLQEAKEENPETMDFAGKLNEKSAEIDRLRSVLADTEQQLASLREDSSNSKALQDEEYTKDKRKLAEALETAASLQSELDALKSNAAEELKELKTRHEQESTDIKSDLNDAIYSAANLRSELLKTESKLASIQKSQTEESANINSELMEAMDAVAALRSDLETANSELSAKEEECVSTKATLADALENNASLQSELEKVKTDLSIARASNSAEEEQKDLALSDAMETIASLQAELQTTKADFASAQVASSQETENQKGALSDATETITSLQAEIETMKAELASAKASEDIAAQDNSALVEALKTIASLQSDLEASNSNSARLQKEIESTLALKDEESAQNKSSLSEATETIDVLESELGVTKAEALNQVEALNSELESSRQTLKESEMRAETKIQELNSNLQALETKRAEAENELETLKITVQSLEEELSKQKSQEGNKYSTNQDEKATPPLPTEGGSFSSGVEVQDPDGDDVKVDESDNDGWGDSWSDDDDDL